jgi:hypothetical protein
LHNQLTSYSTPLNLSESLRIQGAEEGRSAKKGKLQGEKKGKFEKFILNNPTELQQGLCIFEKKVLAILADVCILGSRKTDQDGKRRREEIISKKDLLLQVFLGKKVLKYHA